MDKNKKKSGEISIYFNEFQGDLHKLFSKIKDLIVWNEDIECDLDNVDFDYNEEDYIEEERNGGT